MALDLSLLDAVPALPGPHLPRRAPPAAFEEDPDQPRFEFDEDDEFAALVDDVKLRGILQPLVVRRMPSGLLRIRFGALRYRACVRAAMASIPYVETEDERQFDDYAQVAENARRRPLQPLEMARFVMRKLAAGEHRKDIAWKLHIDASAVTHLLALEHDPPPLLLELYHSRRCRAPYYLYLLRKLWRRDAALVEAECATAAAIDIGLIEELTRQLRQRAIVPQQVRSGDDDVFAPSFRAGFSSTVPASESAAHKRQPGMNRPQLLGSDQGRQLEVLLNRRPDADGMVWVRYDDSGAVAQIRIAGVALNCLRQRCGPKRAGEQALAKPAPRGD